MKKRFTLFSAAMQAMLMVPLLASAAGYLNRISHTASYDYSNMDIGTDTLGGVAYATVACEGMYNGGDPGLPSLPIDYIRFSVPYNATNFTVTATGVRWSSQNLDHMVFPCQLPWFTDGSPAPAITLPDSAAYFSGNPYPSQMAWIADEGFLAGENHIVTVAVMPLRYSHSATADVLSGARRCSLTLSYDLSDSLAMYPIVRNDSLLREEGYQLTQSMVVNPAQVKGFAPLTQVSTGIDSTGFIHGGIGGDIINGGGISGPDPIDPGSLGEEELLVDGGNYTYLIVTTSELKHAMRRLVALKRQKGYNVKIVTMNDVLSSPLSGSGDVIGKGDNAHLTFTDNAGKLRQYIRNHYYYYGTKYVLLAGSEVPYRITSEYIFQLYNDTINETIPSDLYFSDLSADWSIDKYDKQPELYVGRILAKNQEQVTNYTDKLYRYEINPGRGDYSYLNRCFYSQGLDMKANHEVNNVRRFFDNIYPNPRVINEIDNDIPYPTGGDIVAELNSTPYSFISLHHHGCPSSHISCGFIQRVVYPTVSFLWSNSNEMIPSFNWTKTDTLPEFGLNNISNKYYPSICYSIGCETMPFDIPLNYKERGLTMSFGESFITGKDYGGPIYIGNTTRGLTPNSAELEMYIAKQINDGHYKIGMSNSLGKTNLNNSVVSTYLALTQNLLGDPALGLWTGIPQCYSNITVTRNDSSITVSGINGNSTYVSVVDINGGVMKRFVTTDVTINGVSPNSIITLYNHNRIPFIAPLKLQKVSLLKSQYVIASDVVAGYSIDSNHSNGNVTVKNGVEFEVEASGTVTLDDGFIVEKGATFAVYPPCF